MTNTIELNGVIVTAPEGAVISDQFPDISAPPTSKITRLSFRNRFTFAEKVAIETAAETDAVVRVLIKDQSEATYIDLNRVDTQQGTQLLVAKGLITAERASEILSLIVQPGEEYRG